MAKKIPVNVNVCPDTAERIQQEIKRQNFVDAFSKILSLAAEEGFSLCIAKPEYKYEDMRERTMFTDTIMLPSKYFIKE